jgi:hypothetical protein
LTFTAEDDKFKWDKNQDKKQILDYVTSESLNEGHLIYSDNRRNPTPIFDAPYFEQNGKRIDVFQVPILGRR